MYSSFFLSSLPHQQIYSGLPTLKEVLWIASNDCAIFHLSFHPKLLKSVSVFSACLSLLHLLLTSCLLFFQPWSFLTTLKHLILWSTFSHSNSLWNGSWFSWLSSYFSWSSLGIFNYHWSLNFPSISLELFFLLSTLSCSSSLLDPDTLLPVIYLFLDSLPASQSQHTKTLTTYLFPQRDLPVWV